MSDLASVKAMLECQVPALVLALGIDGRRNGKYFIGRNPARADKHAGSFWVLLSNGVWRDEATDEGGDVIKLIMHCKGIETRDALRWARGWLGLAQMPDALRRKTVVQSQQQAVRREVDRLAELAKDRKRAFGVFVNAKRRSFKGSPADKYLRSRGIDISRLGRLPGALGWLPDHRHAETNTTWPVMVASLTGPDNKIAAVHRTFLAQDGSDKAPVNRARKIWPNFDGAAIRLWRGASCLSVDDAAKHGLRETLVIVEGVEDGLSVALACPENRIWCAGTLGNVAKLVLPECVDDVILCADNDWGKPQAQKSLQHGLDALVRQGRTVRVARSHVGKDANDALRGVA